MRKPKNGWEILCTHANEVPLHCPCPPTCGCRYYHCKVVAEKEENVLKASLLQQVKLDLPGFVAIPHQDVRRAGNPDFTLTGRHMTSWWECKHGTPKFDTFDLQELMMNRLAGAGYARYIIWHEQRDKTNRRTLIVHPKNISTLLPEAWCVGFNFRFLTNFFRSVHQ